MKYSCFEFLAYNFLSKYMIWYYCLTLKENREEGDDVGEFWQEIPAWLQFVRHLKLDLHLPLTLRQLHSNACVEQSPSHSKDLLELVLHDYFLPYQTIHHSNWKYQINLLCYKNQIDATFTYHLCILVKIYENKYLRLCKLLPLFPMVCWARRSDAINVALLGICWLYLR